MFADEGELIEKYRRLTDEGRALKEEAAKIPLQVGGCVSLSPEEAATLHSLLYKILETV